jgi:hypothetical protein
MMKDQYGSEQIGADHEDSNPERVEIMLPRARSIV